MIADSAMNQTMARVSVLGYLALVILLMLNYHHSEEGKRRKAMLRKLTPSVWSHYMVTRGFTIVELLIVIVIIAILAAITLVSYNGITRRANNTAVISAAQQSYKLIEAYIAANGTYPAAETACITTTSGCTDESGTAKAASSTFNANIATMGTKPTSVPTTTGIYYAYAAQTYNGVSQPARLAYYLLGTKQQCGLSGVYTDTYPTFTASTTGYTSGDAGSKGITKCWVNIAGPAA